MAKQIAKISINTERIWSQLMELAEIGKQESGGVTRTSLSPEDLTARKLLINWMQETDLEVRVDEAGNIIGRLPGTDESIAESVMTGSHIDSVLNGGEFDGPLGVLGALEAVRTIQENGVKLKRSIELVSFTDEEGARFSASFTGSKGMCGLFGRHHLDEMVDQDGITYSQAFLQAGLNPDNYENARREPGSIKAFVEIHIEQGKVLENEDLSVGIVTGIAGPMWLELTIQGESGHAGTTPMHLRRDSGLAAAELMLQVEQIAKAYQGVGTIGRIHFEPGGVNIIPESASFMIDLRHADAEKRELMKSEIELALRNICEKRSLQHNLTVNMDIPPVLCSNMIVDVMEEACQELAYKPFRIVSGAGHDAMIMSNITDVGMIFVRSKDGISHNPKEWSSKEDISDGVNLLMQTIIRLASE
ncbi:Zn-dependent hydrolase [Neobacillus drentensis]|uniref:Zn-dependent hydrolase n=1 Tax=Neobacillus drentensis TaxID=220684 RepID=UPI001F25B3A1|nr:Zn-dependent hydrolase [Neobacillus drentensis]ULT58777.1 Zn-dependent hydrolase [Neobacillus drentensis]